MFLQIEDLTWILVAMSIGGNVFVIKKNILGLWLWTFANFGWVIYDFSVKEYSQGTLFLIYFFMSIWGLFQWSKDNKKKS